jgi:S1-C subfamily serine protease
LGREERDTIELFRRTAPSVTFITSIARRRDFFSLNIYEIPQGTGSGFVWDERGHVVTNFHVISGSSRARVTLADQSTWEATLVGAAPEKDLAVLRIEAPARLLSPVLVGSSSDLEVGQQVLAIGNPFGLDQTLTTGVISALGREIESQTGQPIRGAIQTDAAINLCNSGGPLLDSGGRLIGVNTAIISPSGAYAGIGFAIPVDTVNWVVPELISRGRIERPSLGVELASEQLRARWELVGALVMRVHRGSGAERAGLEPTYWDRRGRVVLGDLIVAIDGHEVESSLDLILLLERYRSEDRVTVDVDRGGDRRQVEIVLRPSRR